MKLTFCPDCGEKLIDREIGDEGLVPFCEKCNRPWFPMFSTCVIVLVATKDENEVLLLRQNYISTRYFNLVSGYMKPGETAEETARREVQEEVGIELDSLELVKTYWFEKKDMLMIGFIGKTEKTDVKLSGEVDGAKWFAPEEGINYVHPQGSVSYAVVEEFLRRKASQAQR